MSHTTINEVEINGQTYVLKSKQSDAVQKNLPKVEGTPYKPGAKYLIRTITMIYTGLLKSVYERELVLTHCAWIADAGRWTSAIEKGSFSEVEPYPVHTEVIINREAILDMCIVEFTLPNTQK